MHQNQVKVECDFLILNSLAFVEKARPFMERHETIRLYLDRDTAGQKCSQYAVSLSKKYLDESTLYKQHKDFKSLALLEKAFASDTTDARVLMELDQLYKIQNYSFKQRLERLENHLSLVEQRDDLYLERITLYNQLGDYKKAK
jgi:hypothetical protein